MAYDAFISYSRQDKLAAEAACAALESAGIRCWIAPRDISPGAEWGAAIVDAIDHSIVMVLIFSSNANESPQIRREVEHAVSKGVTIVPVRIEQVEPTRSLAYFMAGVHWLDALTPPFENHLQRLATSINAFLRAASANPPSEPGQTQPNPALAAILEPPAAATAGPISGQGVEGEERRRQEEEREQRRRHEQASSRRTQRELDRDREEKAEPQRHRPFLPRPAAVISVAAAVLLVLYAVWMLVPPQMPGPPIVAPAANVHPGNYKVFVQFAGLQRDNVKDMMKKLSEKGWNVQGVDKGGEETPKAVSSNEIRYPDKVDAPSAQALADALQATKIVSRMIGVEQVPNKVNKGSLEIWISQ